MNSQTAGSPVFYIASTRAEEEPNRFGDPVETSCFIDKIALVDGRDGAAFRFEALRRDRIQLGEARFEGVFTALSVRPDGRFLAVTAEEDIGDTIEGYTLIYRSGDMRRTLFQTDAALPAQALTECDIGAASASALEALLAGCDRFDLQQPYTVTWQTVSEDAFPLEFVGWSQDNRAVFRTYANFETVVIQNGQAFLGPDGFVRFSQSIPRNMIRPTGPATVGCCAVRRNRSR